MVSNSAWLPTTIRDSCARCRAVPKSNVDLRPLLREEGPVGVLRKICVKLKLESCHWRTGTTLCPMNGSIDFSRRNVGCWVGGRRPDYRGDNDKSSDRHDWCTAHVPVQSRACERQLVPCDNTWGDTDSVQAQCIMQQQTWSHMENWIPGPLTNALWFDTPRLRPCIGYYGSRSRSVHCSSNAKHPQWLVQHIAWWDHWPFWPRRAFIGTKAWLQVHGQHEDAGTLASAHLFQSIPGGLEARGRQATMANQALLLDLARTEAYTGS